MFKVKKLFSNSQPTKGLLKRERKRTAKVVPADVLAATQKDDVPRQPSPSHTAFSPSSSQPVDTWQWQAAAQQGESHVSSLVLEDQVTPAGPQGQAAAPHSPRGSGHAVLDTLQRWARATLRRIAVVIQQRGQRPEQQRGVEKGTDVAIAGTATAAAGTESQAAAPHSPCCSPRPFSSQGEALSGEQAGAAVEALPSVAKEGTCSGGDSAWDNSSLPELSQGQEITRQALPPVGDINGQELFWGKKKENSKIHTIWVKPLHPPVLPDSHTGCQEGPSCPSSVGREAAQEADADPHSTCPASAGPTGTQPAAEEILPAPHAEEGAFAELDRHLNIHSPQDLAQGQQSGHQSCGSAEERLPMPGPREAWAEQRGLQQPTMGAGAPLQSLSSPYMRPKAPSPERCARSPSPSQLEGLSVEWVGTALRVSNESSELLDTSRDSRGEENSGQLLRHEECSSDTTLPEENWEDIEIYSIWVNPSVRAALLDPEAWRQEGPECACIICRGAAEEADADLHSTCSSQWESLDSQAAAAATAPGDVEQHTALAAKAQDAAKTAASPALGQRLRPAGPQGQAAAPRGPRGSGRTALNTLGRWARATLRGVAVVMRYMASSQRNRGTWNKALLQRRHQQP